MIDIFDISGQKVSAESIKKWNKKLKAKMVSSKTPLDYSLCQF